MSGYGSERTEISFRHIVKNEAAASSSHGEDFSLAIQLVHHASSQAQAHLHQGQLRRT